MLTSFFLKRPQQSLPYLLWALTVSIWAVMSMSGGEPVAQTEEARMQSYYPHKARTQPQSVLSRIYRFGGHSTEEEEHINLRLEKYPLPIHPSRADFANIPIQIRLPQDDGSKITKDEIETELTAIWDLGDNRFWRMECDGQDHLPKRYEVLRTQAEKHVSSKIKYFFALDLYQVRDLLPRLMGTIVHAMKMLGPEKCALSIVEGRSKDGTYAVLFALKEKLETIGVEVYLVRSDINPKGEGVDRIGALAALRNLAIQPLTDGYPSIRANETDLKPDTAVESAKPTETAAGTHEKRADSKDKDGKSEKAGDNKKVDVPLYNNETVIVFVNDIAVCTDDIYELLFQHQHQSAHQTCAMDWVQGGNLFYDSWVSRSMSGDLFFEVPQDLSFSFGENMFWDHPLSKDKFKNKQPFQVYSCWGGMITLSSEPFLKEGIRIRNSTKEECYNGEPLNLAQDLWRSGYGKILTVPTVNVGYNNPDGKRIKKRRGWVKDNVKVEQTEEEWKGTELVKWKEKPPGQVKCVPGWGIVSWMEP